MDTTYIDRSNTHTEIFEKANRNMKEEGKNKEITSFVETYNKLKRKRAMKIIRAEGTLIYKVSFAEGRLRKRIHPNRRVGRPRMNGTEETIKEIWDYLKKDDQRYKYTAFDENSVEQMNHIKAQARTDT